MKLSFIYDTQLYIRTEYMIWCVVIAILNYIFVYPSGKVREMLNYVQLLTGLACITGL